MKNKMYAEVKNRMTGDISETKNYATYEEAYRAGWKLAKRKCGEALHVFVKIKDTDGYVY